MYIATQCGDWLYVWGRMREMSVWLPSTCWYVSLLATLDSRTSVTPADLIAVKLSLIATWLNSIVTDVTLSDRTKWIIYYSAYWC